MPNKPERRSYDTEVAVIQTQLLNIQNKMQNHDEKDDTCFNFMFESQKNSTKEIKDLIIERTNNIPELWNNYQQQKGAFRLGGWLSACAGGMIVAIADFFVKH